MPSADHAGTAPDSMERVLEDPGTPLEPTLRDDMQTRFGHDFSRVRVHANASASRSAKEIDAEAYTVGHHVVFGDGRYSPATHTGRRLLAHELTHVVQQEGGSDVVARKPAATSPAIGSKFTPPAGATSTLKGAHADFDGQDFTVSDSTSVRLTHAAQSGKPVSVRARDAADCGGSAADSYINNPLYVGIQDFGAIPEGEFTFDMSAFAVFSATEQAQMITGGMYTDPFGAALHGGDWGAGRAALHPKRLDPAKTGCGDTRRRSGFYLHGGSLPGSSGCIDIDNSGIAAVLALLGGHKSPVPVKVKYTHAAPSVGGATRGLGRFTYPTKDGKPIKDPSIFDRFKAIVVDDDGPPAKPPVRPGEATPKQQAPTKPTKKKKLKGKGASLDDRRPDSSRLAADSDRLDIDIDDDDEEAVGRPVQARLAIGATDDPLEREADRVADAVIAGPVRAAVGPAVSRLRAVRDEPRALATRRVERIVSSPGAPLAPTLARDMGRRFGRDFSSVRIHADTAAAESARDVSAHAYTSGTNIVFGAGRFAPETPAGRRLLAHELTHVLQQTGDRPAAAAAPGAAVQREGADLPRSLTESYDPATHTYDDLVAEAGRIHQWLGAHPADSVERTDLQAKLAAIVQTANRLGQRMGRAPLAFVDLRPVSKSPEQAAAFADLNRLSNPAPTSPFLQPPNAAQPAPQKATTTAAALPSILTWQPQFLEGLSSALASDAKLQAGWQALKAQLAAPGGQVRFAGGAAVGVVPGAVVAVADIPYSLFKAYAELGLRTQFGQPTKDQIDQGIASIVAGVKKLVARIPELISDVATEPRQTGAWAAAIVSEKIRTDLFLEEAAQPDKPAAAPARPNPFDFSDVQLPDLYKSTQDLLSRGKAGERGKDVFNKGVACGVALGYTLMNIAMLFIGPEEMAAKAGSLGAKGLEALKAGRLGKRFAALAESIPEFKGLLAARKVAAEAEVARTAAHEGEALGGAAKGVDAETSLAKARSTAAEFVEAHPQSVQGAPGSRRADVGGGHQVVEVPDPSVPSGIGCEFHSPPPFAKMPCPAPMGRVQNIPSTKREADAAAAKARAEWEAQGNQPKRFVQSPHLHHLFPEDARLQVHWDRLGIDNQDPRFKVWLNPDVHLKGVHGGHSDPGGLWNAGWLEFFAKHPNANVADVMNQLATLRKSFGI